MFYKSCRQVLLKNTFLQLNATHMRFYADIFQRKLLERGQLPSSYVNVSKEKLKRLNFLVQNISFATTSIRRERNGLWIASRIAILLNFFFKNPFIKAFFFFFFIFSNFCPKLPQSLTPNLNKCQCFYIFPQDDLVRLFVRYYVKCECAAVLFLSVT